MSTQFSPEIILLNITKECRSRLFIDILNDDSILYAALYSNMKSEIFRIYQERYNLMWLKSHWDMINGYIKEHRLTATQKGQLLSQFAKWYCNYVEMSDETIIINSDSISLMQNVINLKIGTLESIIEYNKRCDSNIQRIETSFMKSIKEMNDKVNKLKTERMANHGSY